MKLAFQTAESPVHYYIIETETDYPPSKDLRTPREIFQQQVQNR